MSLNANNAVQKGLFGEKKTMEVSSKQTLGCCAFPSNQQVWCHHITKQAARTIKARNPHVASLDDITCSVQSILETCCATWLKIRGCRCRFVLRCMFDVFTWIYKPTTRAIKGLVETGACEYTADFVVNVIIQAVS